MSDVIRLLPDSVANQIAAGEVIQRPASVIKELVENSVDAGATHIDILVTDAGRTAIQVIDDGKGMSETDSRLAFDRHATSKIRQANDLFSLHTMGFRGEALPSIAAVAQVELKTRTADDEVGTHLSIAASHITGQEPCSCPVGSNFLIENLFYNVPARRKFLKSNTTELNNIITAFQRIALVYPEVAFTLHSNDVEVFNLRKSNIHQRITDVFGRKIDQELLPMGVKTTLCNITGFVGKPEAARKKGARQFFFVNGRYMKHAYFNKAVQSAFERLIPSGEQVPYFIYFEVDPENIDVNIHPTKTEIKFENEQAIWQILAAAVKEAVGKFSEIPTIDFDTEGRPDIPVFNPTQASTASPKVTYDPSYNPFSTHKSTAAPMTPHIPSASAPNDWDKLYEGIRREPSQETEIFESHEPMSTSDDIIAEKSPSHYQYKGTYIMTAVKSGLMIIDQHRAHVRILYERYLKQLENNKRLPQKELFPEVVHFTASEALTLKHVMQELTALGFELTDMGDNSYAVNAIPSGLEGINITKLVTDMIDSAGSHETSVTEEINRSLAISLARNAAIPQGQVLNNYEMENIINQLFACGNVNYTPDGKKILTIFRQQDIEHLLG